MTLAYLSEKNYSQNQEAELSSGSISIQQRKYINLGKSVGQSPIRDLGTE